MCACVHICRFIYKSAKANSKQPVHTHGWHMRAFEFYCNFVNLKFHS